MRKSSAFIALSILLGSVSYCSPPGWIHELPSEDLKSRTAKILLDGYWERPVESPYSVTDSKSSMTGKDYLEIKNQRYTKTHLTSEIVHGESKIEVYRETGSVHINPPLILLTPDHSEYFKKEGKTDDSLPVHAELPGPDDYKLSEKKEPLPLLYYLDANNSTLTPLAMERMGIIYSWGIYEGSTAAHDIESSSFLDAVNIYNNKRFQKHGYIKRR